MSWDWSAIVTAGATAALVIVAWLYARSTKQLADTSKEAAEHARLAAEATLYGAIAGIRPQLTLSHNAYGLDESRKLLADDDAGRYLVPVSLGFAIRNEGSREQLDENHRAGDLRVWAPGSVNRTRGRRWPPIRRLASSRQVQQDRWGYEAAVRMGPQQLAGAALCLNRRAPALASGDASQPQPQLDAKPCCAWVFGAQCDSVHGDTVVGRLSRPRPRGDFRPVAPGTPCRSGSGFLRRLRSRAVGSRRCRHAAAPGPLRATQ